MKATSGPAQELTLKAFCKINLTLEITGKRPDGYHDLLSVVQTVSLADEITVRRVEGASRLQVEGWLVPEGPENLCLQAVELHQTEYGWAGGVRMRLKKNIPPASGLGGGSSDAAATLAALQRLTGLPEEQDELRPLGAELGSDVVLFLSLGAAVISGRGEVVEPLPATVGGWYCVLVWPQFGISTAKAYEQLVPADWSDGTWTGRMKEALSHGADIESIAELLYNSFTQGLEARHPQLREIADALKSRGALGALLCGSGSATFGLFGDLSTAQEAAEALGDTGLWTTVAEPVAAGYEVIR